MRGPNAAEWLEAERREYEALLQQDTGRVVRRPVGKQVLPTMMIYKSKTGPDGQEILKKARFVVKGCCDRFKNTKPTYALTLRFASLRTLLAVATGLGAKVHQLDVKAAFLNGVLPEPIYVEQPRNFTKHSRETHVLELKKALYGLVEAPRVWNQTLHQTMSAAHFERVHGDPCVYVHHSTKGKGRHHRRHITVVAVFVDDFILFGTNEALVLRTKTRLATAFRTKDLGEANWLLGMQVTRRNGYLRIEQSAYAGKILTRFENLLPRHTRRAPTPLSQGTLLKRRVAAEERDTLQEEPVSAKYREVIASLAYLAIGTRPDLAQAVSTLSRFLADPHSQHWRAVGHVLQYLRETAGLGIEYMVASPSANQLTKETAAAVQPAGWVDSDFAGDPETSKSMGGYLFSIRRGAVSWRSKLQTVVATSTCHAEYIAACEGAREAVWLKAFLSSLGLHQQAIAIGEDNIAAQHLTADEKVTDAAKHIRVKWHFVRQCVHDGLVRFHRVASGSNPADALTKCASAAAIKNLRTASGLKIQNGHAQQGGAAP